MAKISQEFEQKYSTQKTVAHLPLTPPRDFLVAPRRCSRGAAWPLASTIQSETNSKLKNTKIKTKTTSDLAKFHDLDSKCAATAVKSRTKRALA